MRRILSALIVVVVIAATALFVGYVQLTTWLRAPLAGVTTPLVYEVARGASVSSVARDLAARGIIEHPRALALWARYTGRAVGIKAGEYEIKPGMSPRAILELFRSGQVLLHSMTFVEGTTFADVRRQLAEATTLRQEAAQATPQQIMTKLSAAQVDAEGQFFPDTYLFPKGTTDLAILSIAHQRMRSALAAAWDKHDPALPYANAYELLIMASIVEKETALERERPLIAGVFVERLRRGMRLQTDPTVIYGIRDTYDGNIRRADLERDTPYNTYTRTGLPPTPICLPGAASLQAAARPELSGALFFVAMGHGDGSHYFSKTLAEHNEAVQRYLKVLRDQK